MKEDDLSILRCFSIYQIGGGYTSQLIAKGRKGVVCGQPGCGSALPGVSLLDELILSNLIFLRLLLIQIKHMSSSEFKTAKKREKTVSRAYGGTLCGVCVRQR
jgi:hypothetical protein